MIEEKPEVPNDIRDFRKISSSTNVKEGKMAADWNEIGQNLFQRWGASACPSMDKDQVGDLLAISIGLGALFNEDAAAERNWMQSQHTEFKTRPITMLLAGHIRQVLEQVNKERNLK